MTLSTKHYILHIHYRFWHYHRIGLYILQFMITYVTIGTIRGKFHKFWKHFFDFHANQMKKVRFWPLFALDIHLSIVLEKNECILYSFCCLVDLHVNYVTSDQQGWIFCWGIKFAPHSVWKMEHSFPRKFVKPMP